MISFKPFWNTLEKSSENTYTLVKNYNISSSTINRLRYDKPINSTTVNDLCRVLECKVEDIMVYVPSDEDQVL